jgi:hypothetical protein
VFHRCQTFQMCFIAQNVFRNFQFVLLVSMVTCFFFIRQQSGLVSQLNNGAGNEYIQILGEPDLIFWDVTGEQDAKQNQRD